MNLLFLTLVGIDSINNRGIYQDLLRKFSNEGHDVTIVTPVERRKKTSTTLKRENNITILQVKTFNITKTNVIEKGIGTLAIEHQYLSAIKKYLKDVKFDLVLYSTPPITFTKVINYIKKRDNAYSYLLLKDIFPQNAVDIKMIRKGGFLHKAFRKKEKQLYKLSDTIGCMSQANVDFVLEHNLDVSKQKVEINPNTIEPIEINYTEEDKLEIRKKYNIPVDKKIFVYGGNLGKPQGLDFLLETISHCNNSKVFFLIVGEGTEYLKIKSWFENNTPSNALLLKSLPKSDYDSLLAACDVGLIFLHKDFLIPNFPSRLLSYLEMKLPVISATDANTDIGDVIERAGCGYKVLSGDNIGMQNAISKICEKEDNYNAMRENAYRFLINEYTVDRSYELVTEKIIIKRVDF